MFSGAIISLVVAVLSAIVTYGGVPNASAAATAQHVYFIAIGLFVVSAMVTILDLQLPRDFRALFARGANIDTATRADQDLRQKRAM
jgi:uncharacterized membrane protein YtjA (UPF0391 family)